MDEDFSGWGGEEEEAEECLPNFYRLACMHTFIIMKFMKRMRVEMRAKRRRRACYPSRELCLGQKH